jgi:uncharacterized protein (TIGR00369 family)
MSDFATFRRIVESSSYHRLIGLTLAAADAEKGVAVVKLGYRPELAIFAEAGGWHGGVIAALIDVAGAAACGLSLGRPTPTVNFRVDYLKSPVRVDLIATGRVVRSGRSIAVADVEIADDAGEIYAVGRGTFSVAAAGAAIARGAEAAC